MSSLRFDEPIHVTRPLLPPLEEVTRRLADVWASKWLTNDGEQHRQLRSALLARLDVPHLSLFNNGTFALLAAVRALGLRGSVLTTPFTFPATIHVLAWSGLTPVFCDIDPTTMTLSPDAVAAAAPGDATAILGVHVYGIPCDVSGLQRVADARGLKVIYDGAHAFGTRLNGTSLGRFGDATMYSFHATKLFHTAEGGALACRSAELAAECDLLKNFGILNQDEVGAPGLNGKMTELQAALGLAVLAHVDEEVERRRAIASRYRAHLSEVPGLTLVHDPPGVEGTCQYMVVRIDAGRFGRTRDEVYREMQTFNVFTRKYFHPLCSRFPAYRDLPSAASERLPVAETVVRQVLCLPMYGALPLEAVDRICDMLLSLR